MRIGLENIQILPLSFVHGIQDKKRKVRLKQVEQFYQEGNAGTSGLGRNQVSEKTAAAGCTAFSGAETYDEGAGSGSMPDHILVNGNTSGMFFLSVLLNADRYCG